MKSWINVPAGSDFTIYNIPLGVCTVVKCVSTKDYLPVESKRTCVTIVGETIIDLRILQEAGAFDGVKGLRSNAFYQPTLNDFLNHPRDVWLEVRSCLIGLLKEHPSNKILSSNPVLQQAVFHDICKVQMQLPIKIGDYTDFYASREHATNVGTMFRGAANALNDNWLQLPVGYHGRSSTVICSGKPIRRPCGQIQKDPNVPVSAHAPTEKLDFELEMAAVIGGTSNIHPMTLQEAKDRIFGYVLMNDWTARDIQKWEYIPLGPFTSKNFATSISPWIVMTAALEGYLGIGNDNDHHYSFSATTSAIEQTNPKPLHYLRDPNYSSYDVKLSVSILTSSTPNRISNKNMPAIVCSTNFRNMYWNAAQQLVHHSITGCVINPGDLIGSGTISGQTIDSYGSMLELSSNGSVDVKIGGGEVRRFLMDGDTVSIHGYCESKNGKIRIGFGECNGMILPPHDTSREGQAQKDYSENRFVDLVLFKSYSTSCSWPVQIALASKQINFRIVHLEKEQSTKKVEHIVDHVSVLQWTDQLTGVTNTLSKLISIINFLDDSFPDRRALIPRDTIGKVYALEVIERMTCDIQPEIDSFSKAKANTTLVESDLMLEGARTHIRHQFALVESLLQKYRENNTTAIGPFALGTFSPTVVDIFLVPLMYDARRINITFVSLSLLVEVESACTEHSWFSVSKPEICSMSSHHR